MSEASINASVQVLEDFVLEAHGALLESEAGLMTASAEGADGPWCCG